jgi:predicted nucleic acid-binding protein
MKYYVDTCVWIDFVEGEKYAEDFFISTIYNEDSILITELVFNEFIKHKSYENIHILISALQAKQLIEYIQITNNQEFEASYLSNERQIPFGDALHAIMTRDNGAVLISRDKHFLLLKDICDIKLF